MEERHAFAGQNVGVTQVGERVWLVSFMQYDPYRTRLQRNAYTTEVMRRVSALPGVQSVAMSVSNP